MRQKEEKEIKGWKSINGKTGREKRRKDRSGRERRKEKRKHASGYVLASAPVENDFQAAVMFDSSFLPPEVQHFSTACI